MSGIDKQARVLELIAKLTGQLYESTRVNVLIATATSRIVHADGHAFRASMGAIQRYRNRWSLGGVVRDARRIEI